MTPSPSPPSPPSPNSLEGLEEWSDDISDIGWLDIPSIIIFTILLVIVALQFFTRYVLNDSIGWSEEIARYFLILLGFTGSIICVRKNKHILLEFAYRYFPRALIKPITLACATLNSGFWIYVTWLAFELAGRTKSNMVSVSLPKSLIYYGVAVACIAMAVMAVVHWWRIMKAPAKDVIKEKLGEV